MRLFLYIVFSCFISIANFGCSTSPAGPALCEELTSADYELISDVVPEFISWFMPSSRAMHNQNPGMYPWDSDSAGLIVISDSTVNVFTRSSQSITEERRVPLDSLHDMTEKLHYCNYRIYGVNAKRILANNVLSVTDKDKYGWFRKSRETDWGNFYGNYPKAAGLVDFSRPVWNEDKSVGLIFVELKVSPDRGTGDLLWLERNDGMWSIKSLKNMWKGK